MHRPRVTRRRLVAASAPAVLAGANLINHHAAIAQDATPAADGESAEGSTPASVQQQIADIGTLPEVDWPVSVALSFTVEERLGNIAKFDELATKSCDPSELFVASGTLSTGPNGVMTFALRDHACPPTNLVVVAPTQVQVTPRSSEPALATATVEIDAGDASITMYSWGVDGQPLPDTWVYWTCMVGLALADVE